MDEYTLSEESYKKGFEAGKEYVLGVLARVVESCGEAITLVVLQKVEEVLRCQTKTNN